MKKTRNGRRQFSREFKVGAVRRVLKGERTGAVARELRIAMELLCKWKKRVLEHGEDHLYEMGRRAGQQRLPKRPSEERRIAELERLVGHQQMEIRFLDKALRRVEELRQAKKDDGVGASLKR